MFKLNDRVEDKDGTEGTIVYIEDALVYVELLSGVEMEYTINDIFPLGTHEDKFNKRVEIHNKKQKNITTNTGDNPLLEEVHKEYIKIYKDINDIFDEASNITTKDDANKAKDRLEQMANYHRDTYQITKK